MLVAGDRLRDASAAHHLDRDAVGQAQPPFASLATPRDAQFMQPLIHLEDFAERHHAIVPGVEGFPAEPTLNHSLAFVQHIVRGDEWSTVRDGELKRVAGDRVEGIGAVEERVESRSVDEVVAMRGALPTGRGLDSGPVVGLQVVGGLRLETAGEAGEVGRRRGGRCEIHPDALADAIGHRAMLSPGGLPQSGELVFRQLNLGANHASTVVLICLQNQSWLWQQIFLVSTGVCVRILWSTSD